MAKVTIDLPEKFTFSTDIQVLIQHINRADHLANENLIAFLNEARLRFTESLPKGNSSIDPRSVINADLAVIYKSEAHHGDILSIEVAAHDFSKYGCDFVYRVTQKRDGTLVAIAKTAMLCFDYENKCLMEVPEDFPALFAD